MPETTTITATLGGVEVQGIRELADIELQAIWEHGEVESTLTTSTFSFAGDAHDRLKQLFNDLPTENPELIPTIEGDGLTIGKKYFVDFRTWKILSDVESEAQIIAQEGNVDFLDLTKGLTMQLLKQKGFLTSADWVRVPYVVENRKRLLEFLTLQISLAQTIKALYDEVFKFVNIVSDLFSGLWFSTAGAAAVAITNLLTSIINLILLTIRLVKLIKDLYLVIFPPIRYHFGLSLWRFLSQGCAYLGYELKSSIFFENLLSRITLLGSKNDEVGPYAVLVEAGDLLEILTPADMGDGLLTPNDFGYTLWESIELTKKLFWTKLAIDGLDVHLRPYNDPWWFQSPEFEIPDVLIEQAMNYQNGSIRYNYEDLVSRTLIRYEKDNSDLHTLTDTNNRVAEVIWEPISVTNSKQVNLRGVDAVEIPYCLNIAKPEKDNMFTRFIDLEKFFDKYQESIDQIWEFFPKLGENSDPPEVATFLKLLFVRKDALLVENHFFSVPKIVLIDPEDGRIQKEYRELLGADALWENYHSYKAMAPGFKNPANYPQTNQKIIFEGVRIPFGPKDWEKTILNNHVTSSIGDGEFTSILWKPNEDHATVDFFIFKNWNFNIKGTLFKLGPQALPVVT